MLKARLFVCPWPVSNGHSTRYRSMTQYFLGFVLSNYMNIIWLRVCDSNARSEAYEATEMTRLLQPAIISYTTFANRPSQFVWCFLDEH